MLSGQDKTALQELDQNLQALAGEGNGSVVDPIGLASRCRSLVRDILKRDDEAQPVSKPKES